VTYFDTAGKPDVSSQCIAIFDDGRKSAMETRQSSGATTADYVTEIKWHLQALPKDGKPGHGTRTFTGYKDLRVDLSTTTDVKVVDSVADDLDQAVNKHQSFAYRYLDEGHTKFEMVVSYGWQAVAPAVPTEFKTIEGKQMLARFTKGLCPSNPPISKTCADLLSEDFCGAATKPLNFAGGSEQQAGSEQQLCQQGRFHAKCEKSCGACGEDSDKCNVATFDTQCSGHGTCEAGGLYGTCKCANGYRTGSCSKQCPKRDGKICGGNGSCDNKGQCVCYGTFGGSTCEVANRVIDLVLLQTSSSMNLTSADHEIPAILGSACHVPKGRFTVLGASNTATGREVRVKISETDSDSASTTTKGIVQEDVDAVLIEVAARESGSAPSADQLVTDLTAMVEQKSTTLKTGPLMSLSTITVEPLKSCPADRFYSCADGTCMPRVGNFIAHGGECCTYNDAASSSTRCPPDALNADLKKCTKITGAGVFSNKFTCSGAESLGANVALAAVLVLATFAVQRR